jgi:hypothetical protein
VEAPAPERDLEVIVSRTLHPAWHRAGHRTGVPVPITNSLGNLDFRALVSLIVQWVDREITGL